MAFNFGKNIGIAFQLVDRGGDTSMAGMAIAIPGVLNILKTRDTMGKSGDIGAKNGRKWTKKLSNG